MSDPIEDAIVGYVSRGVDAAMSGAAERLRICPATYFGKPCGKMFFRVRRQKYCSHACAAREAERSARQRRSGQ